MSTPTVLHGSNKIVVMRKGTVVSDFWNRLAEMVGKSFPQRQEDVGRLFHVGQSSVTKWKTGKDTPSLPRAIEMANTYGVCVEWLLTGRGPKNPGDAADPHLGALLEFWGKLQTETKMEVVRYAKYQRTIQNSAAPERIKEVHEQLPEANHKARSSLRHRIL